MNIFCREKPEAAVKPAVSGFASKNASSTGSDFGRVCDSLWLSGLVCGGDAGQPHVDQSDCLDSRCSHHRGDLQLLDIERTITTGR